MDKVELKTTARGFYTNATFKCPACSGGCHGVLVDGEFRPTTVECHNYSDGKSYRGAIYSDSPPKGVKWCGKRWPYHTEECWVGDEH